MALTERQPAASVPASPRLRCGRSLKSRVCAQGPPHAKLRFWSCDLGALLAHVTPGKTHKLVAKLLGEMGGEQNVRSTPSMQRMVCGGGTGKVPSLSSLVSVSARPLFQHGAALHTHAHGPGSAQRISSNAVCDPGERFLALLIAGSAALGSPPLAAVVDKAKDLCRVFLDGEIPGLAVEIAKILQEAEILMHACLSTITIRQLLCFDHRYPLTLSRCLAFDLDPLLPTLPPRPPSKFFPTRTTRMNALD